MIRLYLQFSNEQRFNASTKSEGRWYMLTAQRSLHPALSRCLCTFCGTRFACSVASLCRSAGFHAPGLPSLRRGALAHRGLARGSSSVQFTRHVWVYTHSHPHFTLYSRVAVQEPTDLPPIGDRISLLGCFRQRCRQSLHVWTPPVPLSVVFPCSGSEV